MKKYISSILSIGLAATACTIVACSKSETTAGNSSSDPNNNAILINGAGSTFDYPALTKWFEAYGKTHSGVRFNYASIGSGGGQKQLLNQTVDFGASDAPMKDSDMATGRGKILHLPIVAGGVAIIYNLPGNPMLKMDGDVIAGMFLGSIKKWDDPKITALNPGVNLPDLPVIPVHRSEGSGTSFIFTDYLDKVNAEWAKSVSKGTSVKWPNGVGLGAKGSEGVAGQVKQISGAVGYAELAYANQNKMSYAEVKNAAGKFVSPSPASVSAALSTATIPDDFRFSMVNPPGEKSYPIAGASWVLLYEHQTNADHGKKLVSFLKWAVTDGQKISAQLDYAPLPENVQRRILELIDTIKY
jgi:phosphate transport system substrate-binding protein